MTRVIRNVIRIQQILLTLFMSAFVNKVGGEQWTPAVAGAAGAHAKAEKRSAWLCSRESIPSLLISFLLCIFILLSIFLSLVLSFPSSTSLISYSALRRIDADKRLKRQEVNLMKFDARCIYIVLFYIN